MPITFRDYVSQFLISPQDLSDATSDMRTLIRSVRDELKGIIMTAARATQADVQALADQLTAVSAQISAGVQELDDEITRLGTANPALDLTPLSDKLGTLQGIADQLANDNVPSAPEPPAEPVA